MIGLQTYLKTLAVRGKLLVVAALFGATGLASVISTGTAHAITFEWCINNAQCLNAWGTGPAVNVYSPHAANNQFQFIQAADTRYYNIQFLGSGLYHNWCIGDNGNDPNSARAGLLTGCGTVNIGWGGNFQESLCNDGHGHVGQSFKNVHWPGWLGPQNNSNGSPFYLNKPSAYCFLESEI